MPADPDHERASSVVVRQARLVPVGTPAPTGPVDVRIEAGRITEVAPTLGARGDEAAVDADGRWAVPGLWDHHVHLAQWAQTRRRLDVGGCSHPRQVTDRVAAHVALLPAGDRQLIVGTGYRSAMWAEPPTVAALDAVSGAHPVVLVSGDGHNGWLSTAALRLLGLPDRDGVLDENDWFAVHPRLATVAGTPDDAADYRDAVAAAAAQGIVGVVDMELAQGYRDWPERFGRGVDQLRVRVATYPDRLDEVLAAGLRSGQPLPGGGGLLTMGPLKIISDGSLGTRTAYCVQPYAGAPPGGHPRGKQNYPAAELVDLLTRARAAGLTAAVHAIGDAALSVALDAFETTGAAGSIEHAQLVTREDVARMARLGVRASVQPAHLLDDRDATEQCWPDRADRCFLFRSMRAAGVTLAFGSDAPVAPLDPWLAMAAAVHRSGDEREPWHPEESLSAAEALAASTDGHGTVAAGHPGDLVLLDDDPLRPAAATADVAAHLRAMRVAATFVAGRATHLAL
jgi:predicted amidohydrolase YtcJ